MPPPSKKDCGVILFDVNASNKNQALAALMKICTYNWLSCTKNMYRIILSNTNKTKNEKNYPNLYDTGISDADPQPILNHIEKAEPQEGNWLDALLLAINNLKNAFGLPGVITLQILYITKLDGCSHSSDMSKVEKIINDLREYGIYLYIIGPDVKLARTITKRSEVSAAMKELTLDESNEALTLAKRIVDATDNSIITDLKLGINLFYSYRNPRGSQPWKVPLSFGTRLEFPASTVKIIRSEEPFKLIVKNKRYKRYVLAEDETVNVKREVMISGIERHGKFVRVEGRDMFKVEGPRCFAVIGFTHKSNIPEYYMREGSFCTLPDPAKPDDCSQALYTLIDVLAEEEKYVIVKRVYNANNKPKFFVLVPQANLEPKRFLMAGLPYADDLKQHCKFSEAVSTETTDDEDFKRFFDSLDICNEDCKIKIPLGPQVMLSSYISKLVNAAASKYLKREFDFDGLDIDIDIDEEETNEYLEAVKASWPVSVVGMDTSTTD